MAPVKQEYQERYSDYRWVGIPNSFAFRYFGEPIGEPPTKSRKRQWITVSQPESTDNCSAESNGQRKEAESKESVHLAVNMLF